MSIIELSRKKEKLEKENNQRIEYLKKLKKSYDTASRSCYLYLDTIQNKNYETKHHSDRVLSKIWNAEAEAKVYIEKLRFLCLLLGAEYATIKKSKSSNLNDLKKIWTI